jgi:DNA-binding MarR family transcriptional regulator
VSTIDQDEPGRGSDPAQLRQEILDRAREWAPESQFRAMATVLDLFLVSYRMLQDVESTVHRPSGTTWAAFRILFTIAHGGPRTPAELAALYSVSKATVSGVVKGLERDGLLTRETAPGDGRKVVLSLTSRGRSAAAVLLRRQSAREQAWTAALTPKEQDTLDALLAKLLAHVPPDPAEPATRIDELAGDPGEN